jgi:hypothetical protein
VTGLNGIKPQVTKNLDFGTHIEQAERRKGWRPKQLANLEFYVGEKIDTRGNRHPNRPKENVFSIVCHSNSDFNG